MILLSDRDERLPLASISRQLFVSKRIAPGDEQLKVIKGRAEHPPDVI
jgi:hypothetical protein